MAKVHAMLSDRSLKAIRDSKEIDPGTRAFARVLLAKRMKAERNGVSRGRTR